MKKVWLTVVLALACCVASTTDAFAVWYAPSTSVTIRPGRSVGKVNIGMSRQSPRKVMGPRSNYNDHNSKQDMWYEVDAEGNGMQGYYVVVDYINSKVVQIVANLPNAATPGGFSMHSSLTQIKRNFNGIKRTNSFPNVDVREDVYSSGRLGIGFSFIVNGKFVQSSDSPGCFIVFKPGRRIVPSWI